MDAVDRVYERVLVLRCQAGDEAAFEEIVGRYHARLRYYFRKMLPGVDNAEDLLQDVWFQVYRGAGQLADPGAFRAWLYRIARNCAFAELRRRRLSVQPVEEADLPEPGPDDNEFSAEDSERVHAGLDTLTEEHREVLILRFIEEMNYDDIARITGCRVGTVRSRIHYAKHALREAIERSGNHDRERTGRGSSETR